MSYTVYTQLLSHKQLLGRHAARLHAANVASIQTILTPPKPSLGCHFALGSNDKLWAALESFG